MMPRERRGNWTSLPPQKGLFEEPGDPTPPSSAGSTPAASMGSRSGASGGSSPRRWKGARYKKEEVAQIMSCSVGTIDRMVQRGVLSEPEPGWIEGLQDLLEPEKVRQLRARKEVQR